MHLPLQAEPRSTLITLSSTRVVQWSFSRHRTAVRTRAAPRPQPVDLTGRNVAILWDLDNLQPSSLARDLAPAIRELRRLLVAWGGCIDCIKLYANNATYAKLDRRTLQQLAHVDAQVVKVQTRDQAADMKLTADAYEHARSPGEQRCTVLASNDTGFGPILAYIGSLGVFTILLASFVSKKQIPHLLPSLTDHPVARGCDAALSWQPPQTAATPVGKRRQLVTGSRVPLGTASGWLLASQLSQSLAVADLGYHATGGNSSTFCSKAETCSSNSKSSESDLKFIEAVWMKKLCQQQHGKPWKPLASNSNGPAGPGRDGGLPCAIAGPPC